MGWWLLSTIYVGALVVRCVLCAYPSIKHLAANLLLAQSEMERFSSVIFEIFDNLPLRITIIC